MSFRMEYQTVRSDRRRDGHDEYNNIIIIVYTFLSRHKVVTCWTGMFIKSWSVGDWNQSYTINGKTFLNLNLYPTCITGTLRQSKLRQDLHKTSHVNLVIYCVINYLQRVPVPA